MDLDSISQVRVFHWRETRPRFLTDEVCVGVWDWIWKMVIARCSNDGLRYSMSLFFIRYLSFLLDPWHFMARSESSTVNLLECCHSLLIRMSALTVNPDVCFVSQCCPFAVTDFIASSVANNSISFMDPSPDLFL